MPKSKTRKKSGRPVTGKITTPVTRKVDLSPLPTGRKPTADEQAQNLLAELFVIGVAGTQRYETIAQGATHDSDEVRHLLEVAMLALASAHDIANGGTYLQDALKETV